MSNYTDETELDSGDEIGSAIPLSNGGAEALREHAAEAYAGTKKAVVNAYERTAEAAQSGYKQAVEYGTKHPERLSLMAFAAGLGAGAFLGSCSFTTRRGRTERIATPLIDAAAEVARAALKR